MRLLGRWRSKRSPHSRRPRSSKAEPATRVSCRRAAAGICILATTPLAGQSRIVEHPLPFGVERQQLTLDYVRAHYDSTATTIRIAPHMIVIHATETASLDSTLRLFEPERLPAFRADIVRGGAVNVSSHYLVDRDGTIYHLVPDTVMARHVIGLNRIAIGIENVGGGNYGPLNDRQLEADRWLVQRLVEGYPGITYLIGHSEYERFRHTPLWEERDSTYRTPKTDPGDSFMLALRQRVSRAGLKDHWAP
jgi:N-acetyl-anhydromuramyl-L-alanine amidase AmpD